LSVLWSGSRRDGDVGARENKDGDINYSALSWQVVAAGPVTRCWSFRVPGVNDARLLFGVFRYRSCACTFQPDLAPLFSVTPSS